jgi:murein DD-endopeptidase MepM/ murein hydrolase activator NlpD
MARCASIGRVLAAVLALLPAVSPAQDERLPVEGTALAHLRLEHDGERHLAWVENRLAGPVEVLLHAGAGAAPATRPPLPARATVPARGRRLVAWIDAAAAGPAPLRLEVVPGHPNARPRDVEYGFPLDTRELRLTQGWGGAFSHADAGNRHAIDLAAPEGTPVLAARDGVVMQVEDGFSAAGLDRERDGGRANLVRILHDDGTMALYAHLQPGALVRPGQRVRRGARIALSGNTGFSVAPHLHFVVQANRGLKLESIPFRMFGPGGILRFDAGQAVAAPAL